MIQDTNIELTPRISRRTLLKGALIAGANKATNNFATSKMEPQRVQQISQQEKPIDPELNDLFLNLAIEREQFSLSRLVTTTTEGENQNTIQTFFALADDTLYAAPFNVEKGSFGRYEKRSPKLPLRQPRAIIATPDTDILTVCALRASNISIQNPIGESSALPEPIIFVSHDGGKNFDPFMRPPVNVNKLDLGEIISAQHVPQTTKVILLYGNYEDVQMKGDPTKATFELRTFDPTTKNYYKIQGAESGVPLPEIVLSQPEQQGKQCTVIGRSFTLNGQGFFTPQAIRTMDIDLQTNTVTSIRDYVHPEFANLTAVYEDQTANKLYALQFTQTDAGRQSDMFVIDKSGNVIEKLDLGFLRQALADYLDDTSLSNADMYLNKVLVVDDTVWVTGFTLENVGELRSDAEGKSRLIIATWPKESNPAMDTKIVQISCADFLSSFSARCIPIAAKPIILPGPPDKQSAVKVDIYDHGSIIIPTDEKGKQQDSSITFPNAGLPTHAVDTDQAFQSVQTKPPLQHLA